MEMVFDNSSYANYCSPMYNGANPDFIIALAAGVRAGALLRIMSALATVDKDAPKVRPFQ